MRTTVTLVPDAERLIRNAMKHSGQSFKEVLNEAIPGGLANERMTPERRSFSIGPGVCLPLDAVIPWPRNTQPGSTQLQPQPRARCEVLG